MQYFDASNLWTTVGSSLPLAILLIENDEDRQFLAELYLQYRGLLYKEAVKHFGSGSQEIEDAVGNSAVRMCKYCKKLQSLPCNKRPFYLVKIVRSVCNTQLAELQKQSERHDWFADSETAEDAVDESGAPNIVFSRVYADDLLNSFVELSQRDRELIRMRHIDLMNYDEIAKVLHISEGTARTAVSRAKARLENLARSQKDDLL